MDGRHCVKLPQADPLTVNGHCYMFILVGVDSDDQINTTTTFMTDDSCHFHLLEGLARRPGERTGLRWGLRPGSLYVGSGMKQSFQGRIGVRQTGGSLVMEGRLIARVAAPTPKRARTVAWANQARILQGRANNSQEVLMDQETTYVGIDVAKAQLDVAVRPSGDRWEVPHDEAGVRQLVSHLKALEPVTVLLEASGGLELASGSCAGSRGCTSGRRQPSTGEGLRQSHR